MEQAKFARWPRQRAGRSYPSVRYKREHLQRGRNGRAASCDENTKRTIVRPFVVDGALFSVVTRTQRSTAAFRSARLREA